mgnify:FL=1
MNRNNLRVVMQKYGPKIKEAIAEYMIETDRTVTGKTARSVSFSVFEGPQSIGIAIGGNKVFATLHSGRKPGLRAPSYISIKKWMDSKSSFRGKKTIESAKTIARAIGRDGFEGENISYKAALRVLNALITDSSAAYVKDVEEHLKKSISKNVN